MSAPTIIPARRLHPTAVQAAWMLLAQHRDLPAPTSVLVEATAGGGTHVTLTVDTPAAVDGWAEAMNVEMDSTLHNDGTWTDEAAGELDIVSGGRGQWSERVAVTVQSPQVTTAHPVGGFAEGHTHLAASGQEQVPCPDPGRCAEQAAEDGDGPLLDEPGPDARNPQVADRIMRNMALRNGLEVQL